MNDRLTDIVARIMLAGLLPALRALRTDIHHTLSEG